MVSFPGADAIFIQLEVVKAVSPGSFYTVTEFTALLTVGYDVSV